MTAWIHQHWLKLLAIALVLGALASFPYAYYQIMNWIVVVAAGQTVYQAYTQKKEFIAWMFVGVAIIFNPIAPLYFRADVWQVADIIVALLFLAAVVLIDTPRIGLHERQEIV